MFLSTPADTASATPPLPAGAPVHAAGRGDGFDDVGTLAVADTTPGASCGRDTMPALERMAGPGERLLERHCLQRRHRVAAQIMQAGVDATIVTDQRGRVTLANRAADDVGTGFGSLSMLQRVPIDRAEIDRPFVRDKLENRGDAAIARSIVPISRNLEPHVTAEGVEHQAQAELLRGLGCNAAQGFLCSPALSPRAFEAWLASQTAQPDRAPWLQAERRHG
ncbi:MAG TPA: EAL domain-containing protein [Lysobacter sp.]